MSTHESANAGCVVSHALCSGDHFTRWWVLSRSDRTTADKAENASKVGVFHADSVDSVAGREGGLKSAGRAVSTLLLTGRAR